jgi:hypothetical protein
MYYRGRSVSMLMPHVWEPEATELGDILCDQAPGVAGIGAVTMAMQALNLTADQASALVGSQGGTNVSAAALSGAVQQAGGTAGAALTTSPNGSRLPITPTVNPALQFLAGDPNRAILIIQNNEPTSGGATLLVSFDPINASSTGYVLNFGPGGFGILLDQNVFSNPIYVGWSGTATVGGVMMYGSKPNAGKTGVVLRPTLSRVA